MMLSLVATLFIYNVSASPLCLHWLIQDDPHQFSETPKEWLEKEFDRLTIRLNWNTASYQERQMLIIIENELKFRSLFP